MSEVVLIFLEILHFIKMVLCGRDFMQSKSLLGSYFKTIVEPYKMFNELQEKPNTLRPFLIILLSGIILTVVTFPHTFKEIKYLFNLDSSISTTVVVFFIFTFLICGSVIIEWVMLSVLLYFIISLLSPAISNFRIVFSVAGFSWVPIILKTISFATLVLITGEVFEPVGLRVLVPNLDHDVAVALLNQVEPFLIWQFVLLYFGVKALLKSERRVAPLLIVSIIFVANLTLKTIPSIMTSFL